MMNMEMIQKEREANIKKMWDELLDVQMELIDDKKVCETNRVDFSFAPCYFELENVEFFLLVSFENSQIFQLASYKKHIKILNI